MAKRRVKKRPTKKGLSPKGEKVGELNGFPVHRVRVKDIIDDVAGYNPREIRESALQGLKNSVDEFGMPQPIVWNVRTSTIVGGHQRLKTLDLDESTDIVVVDLDREREKALNLAFNNPHISGDWASNLTNLLNEVEHSLPDLISSLKLDELKLDVPKVDDLTSPAPEEFPEVDEDSLKLEHQCPKCGFEW